MIISTRLANILTIFGIGTIIATANAYIVYPYLKQRRLLKLLKKLDDEGRVDEMKEIVKSPLLQNYSFEFKDEVLSKTSQNQ